MICTRCSQFFDGAGVICPECRVEIGQTVRLETGKPQVKEVVVLPEELDDRIYPAGYVGRILAAWVDGIILQIISWGFFLIVGLILSNLFSEIVQAAPSTALKVSVVYKFIIAWLTSVLVFVWVAIFYSVIFEASPLQATPGKMLLGLKVSDINGRRISFFRAFARCCFRYLAIVPILTAIFLSYYLRENLPETFSHSMFILSAVIALITYPLIFFTDCSQGLHDLLSGCVVQEKEGAPAWGFPIAIFIIVGSLIGFLLIAYGLGSTSFVSRFKSNYSYEQENLNSPAKIAKAPFESVKSIQVLEKRHDVKSNSHVKTIGDYSVSSVEIDNSSVRFKDVSVSFDKSKNLLSIFFYQQFKANLGPSFTIEVAMSGPLSSACSIGNSRYYNIIFNAQSVSEIADLKDKIGRISLSRVGSVVPAGENAELSCRQEGNKIQIKGRFTGQSSYTPLRLNKVVPLQWNIAFEESVSASK